MPGWNIHLEVGERVAARLKLSGKKKEQFLLGCLLPDINNDGLHKAKFLAEHEETHWAFDEKSSLNFGAKYLAQIERREPMYLGYLLHLYTDGYFNYHYFHHVKRTQLGENLSKDEKQEIKANDFHIYDMKYDNRALVVSDKVEAVKIANKIEHINIDEEDLLVVEKILQEKQYVEIMKGKKYIFYTEKWLDELMNEMIESFMRKYLNEE